MSVYIKGMEMPKAGRYFVAVDNTDGKGKIVISVMSEFERGDKTRPLLAVHEIIPVPPHGRLGDLDEINEKHDKLSRDFCHGYFKSTWDFVCAARKIFYDAPTIIPAEEGET